jgi:hypothetical protein
MDRLYENFPWPFLDDFIAIAVAASMAVIDCKKTPAPAPNTQATGSPPAPNQPPPAAPAPADTGNPPAVASEIPLKDPAAFQSPDPKSQA